jgi:hypothetical protein
MQRYVTKALLFNAWQQLYQYDAFSRLVNRKHAVLKNSQFHLCVGPGVTPHAVTRIDHSINGHRAKQRTPL